ncbi:MAG: cyclodeaminase/cyclohydrolase family protein, partial [Erysipelotrichaceae bacterium]|nr:cyclodeaminase/cyclohydrolase family protein [Erysipelotrichaceae bacterium]
ERFTELLASSSAVPGGGGASALVGAIAIALGDMVGELTVGKKKYADVEEEIEELMIKAQDLRVEFLNCINDDARAFEPLSKAYGLPKDEPGRDEILEKCLKDAAAAPLKVFDLCCVSVELLKEFGEKGSKLMISDAATGIAFARGALYGAAVNVRVNTRLMKDREYAQQLDAHIADKLNVYSRVCDEVYESIYQKLSYQDSRQ